MRTLCIDTSTNYLVFAIVEGNKLIAKLNLKTHRNQSELFFVELEKLCKSVKLTANDFDAVCVSSGPGSYTGVRIGMTVAKVMCSSLNIPCYEISTFQLLAGLNNCEVIIDARGKKVFSANVENGEIVGEPTIKALDDKFSEEIIGDTQLLGLDVKEVDIAENFYILREHWKLVENIHILTPMYLKGV